MDSVDKRRGTSGVVVSLLDVDNDKIQIMFDDVENSSGRAASWVHRVFVTCKDYDRHEIENLEISDEEYAALGHYVLARLTAIRKTS